MIFGKCKKCKKIRFLTKHSPTGDHQPPYVGLCRPCHDEEDNINPPKPKIPKKYAKGTKRQHKRGWKK